MMHPYVIGILWALGRYVDDNESPGYRYFFLRHNQEFFLHVVRKGLNLTAKIIASQHKGKPQYRLKISRMDVAALEKLGWSPRWEVQRQYPKIVENRDFIRAYVEIHGRVDTATIKSRGRVRKQPRLRIYGNRTFLGELTEVLASQIGTGIKKIQKATNESIPSGVLYYQSRVELQKILDYLYPPGITYFSREVYEAFRDVLITAM